MNLLKSLSRLVSISAIFAVALTTTSYAGKHDLRLNDKVKLPHCGGKVSFEKKKENYVLDFEDIQNCSNLDLNEQGKARLHKSYKLELKDKNGPGNGPRHGTYTLPASQIEEGSTNRFELRLRSNSAPELPNKPDGNGTWEEIKVEFYVEAERTEITIGQWDRLDACGGTIKVTKSAQGNGEQLNVVIKDVEKCSNFVWESNGRTQINKDYKMQKNKDGNYGGSYTLSWDHIHNGNNTVYFKLTSNSGNTVGLYKLIFRASGKK